VFDHIVCLRLCAFWVGYQPHRQGVHVVAVVGIAATSARSAHLIARSDDVDATNSDDEMDGKPALY
jgi:hypothetical protein